MPVAPPRVCARCGGTTAARQRCACRPAFEGSTNRGGSDRRWRKMRDAFMAAHPLCQSPGCPRTSSECDHIIPLAQGGERMNVANLQALCHPCHARKTTADALRGKTRLR